jgi:uncharacterized protein YdeI (BOF family)
MKFVTVFAIAVLMAAPALAKQQGVKGKGVFCSQGGDNAFISAAQFKPSVRARMIKGQKVKVNIAGYGPVSCTVY